MTATSLDLIWISPNLNITVVSNNSIPIHEPASVFVTINGDIYAASGNETVSHVLKWKRNSTNSSTVMQVPGNCFAVFVDVYDNIYCSMVDHHQVVKRSFFDTVNMTNIIAGNSTNGSESNMLSSPRGIFVTKEFDLYVADCGNNRIQRFRILGKDMVAQ